MHKFIDFIFANSLQISSIALIALSIIDISNLNEYKISSLNDFPIGKSIYILTVAGAVIFGIISIENSKNINGLEKDNEEQSNKIIDLETGLSEAVKDMNELFNSYLMLLVKNLDFNHTERISVYKVFDECFILLGRSSNNPNLNASGRSNYPLKDGFIGKAWAEGEYYIDNLPDPSLRKGDTYYTHVNSICNIPREVVKNLNMQSRTFYIHRFDGYDGKPKAIIVIESLNPNAFTKEDVLNKLNEVKQPLIMFIEKNNHLSKEPTNKIGL